MIRVPRISLLWSVVAALILAPPATVSVRAAEFNASTGRGEVAVIFDDLPFVSTELDDTGRVRALLDRLIATIKSSQIPAVGFVNGSKLYRQGKIDTARVGLLQSWVNADLELGNHTFSHVSLNRSSAEAFAADIIRGEEVTKALLEDKGMRLRYFRYPFDHFGRDADVRSSVEAFLVQRGYTVVPNTVNGGDWAFALAYGKANERGDADSMQRVAAAYIAHVERAFEYSEKLSFDLFGSNIPHVLVLHANSLNSAHMDELVEMMKRRGYRFVAPQRALDHAAYRAPENYAGPDGTTWLQRRALAVGLRPGPEAAVPQFVVELAGPSLYQAY